MEKNLGLPVGFSGIEQAPEGMVAWMDDVDGRNPR